MRFQHLQSSYWITRNVFLRCLGFVYFVAFYIAWIQNGYLIGERGLTPAVSFLDKLSKPNDTIVSRVISLPSVFCFLSATNSNLNLVSFYGMCISFSVMLLGTSNMVFMSILWVLYTSIVNIGQTWYSFGWESQLLETGFLAIFLVPFITIYDKYPKQLPTPMVCVWGYRWLLFRIMIGAGLIKIRGDSCWRDLTCMNYHYLTQPVPNPVSNIFHNTPEMMHKLETLSNHIIELLLPWFLFFPRPFRIAGGVIQILFQVVLISSGNLSFLNWLTILPAIFCFDDAFFETFCSLHSRSEVSRQCGGQIYFCIGSSTPSCSHEKFDRKNIVVVFHVWMRRVMNLTLAVLLTWLSVPVVKNLLSSRQAMNTSFDVFRIVNTYGAFGSISRERTEVILQGTTSTVLSEHTVWKEFQFNCKPGDINRMPCFISPYHYRIDWLMWFAAFQNYQSNPWLIHLAVKLLRQDPVAISLLASGGNPFSDDSPPHFLRMQHYKYEYAKRDAAGGDTSEEGDWEEGKWWRRRWLSEYTPPLSLDNPSVIAFLNAHGWS